MIRLKRIMSLTLVFLILITGIDLTIFKEENTADANSNITYALVVGYFEYWKDSSGNYMYDDKDGVRHVMGKNDPSGYSVSNYTYPVATIGTTHKIKNIYSLPYYSGNWADLNYTALEQAEVRDFYLDSAVVSNASHLIGASETQVMFTTSFYPRSTEDSKEIQTGKKWRNYIAMVIEYEPANSADVTINYLDKDTGQKIKTSENKPLKLNSYNSYPVPTIKGYDYKYYKYNKGADNKGLSIYFYADAKTTTHTVDVYYQINNVVPPDPPPPTEYKIDAVLKLEVPEAMYTNYKDFQLGGFSYDPFLFGDGTESTADLPIKSYAFNVKVGNVNRYQESNKATFMSMFPINTESVDVFNGIPVNASLEIEDTEGNTDTDTKNTFIPVNFFNTRPEAKFTYPSEKLYATVPIDIIDGSSDFENDMNYRQYVIKDSLGSVILQAQIFENNSAGNFLTSNQNIVDATISNNDLNLNFKEKGYYTIDLLVWDKGASELNVKALSDTHSETIYVNSEPAPPIADFTLPEFGFPSTPVSIVDKSTDPNDDIVKWEWTKPAQATGTLENSGGVVTFDNKGEYTVSLKVTDATNFSDTATKKIKIIDPMPIANITDTGSNKRNRKMNVSMKDSLNPSLDPIQISRNIWTITPIDGQNLNHINIDVPGADISVKGASKEVKGYENLDLVFNDVGKYKIGVLVNNNFSDNNGSHPSKDSTYTEKIITISEDEIPQGEFELSGANPNFKDNPLKTTADVKATAFSIDSDLIDSYKYTIIRDNNENGDFTDDTVYGTYTTSNALVNVYFQQGNSGKFKAILELKEEFGQPTIEKFANKGTLIENVTEKGRRTAVIEKIFDINWIPDITFNLPEFAYTDDTLNLTTKLKDEEIDTLNVEWTLKKAREGNTSILDDVDLNSFTDNVLDNNGGQIRFKESGYYELIGTVTDEIGQVSFYKDTIRIYPLPTAVIKDAMSFRGQEFVSKENRKYKLHGNESYAKDYYGNELHAIDHNKDYWELIPLDGQDAITNIKVADGAGELKSDTANPSKYSKFNNSFDEELLFKLKGRYKVRYQVTNIYGKKSPFAEQIITVAEDTKPIISFDTLDKTYRNPDDSNLATIAGHSISATSDDDDIIEIQRIRYRFDSNNDGNFEDETWSSEVAIDSTDKKASVKVAHVGKYQFEFYVKEKFGQETIDQFVTDSDRKRDTKMRSLEVDNMAPTVDFTITPSNKVDIVFTLGKINKSKVQEINTKIDTYVKAFLESNNTDLIDTRIQTIDTDFTSSNDVNAKQIFDSWAKYPQTNYWGYDEATKSIYNNDNPGYETGIYDPTKFESRDFEMQTKVYSNEPTQPLGILFKMHKSPTYADRYNMYYWWASGSHAVLFKVENAKINEPRNKMYNGSYSATPLLSFNTGSGASEYYHNGWIGSIGKTYYNSIYGVGVGEHVAEDVEYGDYGTHGGNSSSGGYWDITGTGKILRTNTRKIDLGRVLDKNMLSKVQVKANSARNEEIELYISKDNINWTKMASSNEGIYLDGMPLQDFRYIKVESVNKSQFYINRLEVWLHYKTGSYLGWNEHSPYDYGGFPHMTPLERGLTVSNIADPIMKTTILDYVPVNHTQGWHDMSVSMKGNKIVSTFDSSTIETIDSSAYDKGTMGFFQYSHVNPKFKDFSITTGDIKSLEDALRNTVWRKDATKFLVDLSDEKLEELEPTSSKYSPTLARLLNEGVYFAELGTDTNKNQTENFIKANDSKGKFFYNNQPNMDKALDNLGKWILETVKTNKKIASKYILLDDLVNYDIFYKDYENDPKMEDVNKWKYVHDSLYYQNSLGQVSYNNQWLDESKNSFNKVGKFTVEYKTRDNPVGTDDRFDNYRKWSSMLNGPLDIFVHRKPIATFKANVVKSPTTFTISYTDNSYDLDHQSRVAGKYKLDINNNIILDPGGYEVQAKGIVQRQWQWREVGETTWNDGQLNTGNTTKEYLVRLRVKDMDGAVGALTGTNYNLSGNAIAAPNTFNGVWSDWETVLITGNPQPPIARFILSDTVLPIESTLGITDVSYDPNGDPIVEWQWKLYKEGTLIGTFANANSQSSINTLIKTKGIGKYTLTLQVRDNTGAWGNPLSTSNIYSQDFKVVPVNHPPIVDFNPDFTWIPQRAIRVYDKFVPDNIVGKRWNSTYSDPDADNQGFILKWTANRYIDSTGYSKSLDVINTGELETSKTYSGDIPFDKSFEDNNLKYGAYQVTFAVTDKPPVPPFEPTDAITSFVTKNMYVLPRLELEPSYSPEGPAVNTKTITLKAKTNDHVTKVKVTFLGEEILLDLKDSSGNTKYWEKDFTIPATNTLFGMQTANFRAYCNYGNMGDLYYIDKSIDIEVRPLLTIKGDYKGEPITGETIALIAETTDTAITATVEFLGDLMNMTEIPASELSQYYSDTSPNKKYWKVDYVIPDTVVESKPYPATFKAYDAYGQEAIDIIDIYVIALRLINFRITDIVNHPMHNFPLTRIDFPSYYKAGYKVTFRINAIGSPVSVVARLYEDTSFAKEVNMTNVGANGNETIWEGTYYSNARIPIGTLIKINLKGFKGMTTYDYNYRESWNDGGTLGSDVTGIILRTEGTALQDGIINRTN